MIMKGIILLNGDPYKGEIQTDGKIVICCDGAYNWVKEAKIRIDVCLGDFDSLGYVPEGAEVYPVEKNMTDGELALHRLKERGVSDVEIYGGSGKREDHFFGNVGLLVLADRLNVRARMISDYTEFYIVKGKTFIKEREGTTISLVPISESVHINSSVGLKYDASDITLWLGEGRGLSNILTKDNAVIDIDGGEAILFIVRKL